ncbi:MAG: sigma-70 family RNA polymerase sigma factor [Planctomycetes bacterium]|nr:sigma-70 family RNA polymerase sigma factor [Planctomycetota bacterium]
MSDWIPDIAKLQRLDDDEWLKVEREYAGRLYHYVARRVTDREARHDVLQETLLGAVRGIGSFDPTYTFEQYVFGICHNRTVDWMRRRRIDTLQSETDEDEPSPIERLATSSETPSQVVRRAEFSENARRLLAMLLREWVQETWGQGEFVRLMVIEALFFGGWRNKDTWKRFGLNDETSVAGIKFRALVRIRELAQERPEAAELFLALSRLTQAGEANFDFDVSEVWRASRASCPARVWLARTLAGTLPAGPKAFVDFHLDEMRCEFCRANVEDLRTRSSEELDSMHERARASTLGFLRSRGGSA